VVAPELLPESSTVMMLGALVLSIGLATAQHDSPSPTTTASPVASVAAAETPGATPPAPVEATPASTHGATEAQAKGAEEHGESPAQVLMHHVMDQPNYEPFGLPIPFPTKHLFFLLAVMALVIVVARIAIASYRNGAPKGIGSVVETLVVYVRDEIAEKNIGHGDGAKYTPLLLSFFFFILFAALVGLLPFSGTSTGNLSVTLALAFISFLAQQYAGMSKYGVAGHFKNLVPHGLPAPLLIVMIPIEILGMFTKPFALMVRLFANMLAGHMIITALLLLVPLSAKMSGAFGVAMIPVSLGMALFIMCLEVLVAFIQAYVFTLFTAIFIGMYAHPSH
jgi:F-type H+-transporting ATPase subunit a